MPHRCDWAKSDPLLVSYHDEEWGTPIYDSRELWEKLVLDGFQAGLAWITVLKKRDAFRHAFQGFDPEKIAAFGEADVERLMQDAGIIRSRTKIVAAIGNARAYLAMAAAGEDFGEFVWGMAGGDPLQNEGPSQTQTEVSAAISVALKKRGFKFVGPTIVHAWMQATGLVNDHAVGCYRRKQVAALARKHGKVTPS